MAKTYRVNAFVRTDFEREALRHPVFRLNTLS